MNTPGLHYEIHAGGDRVLVFVHGWAGWREQFSAVIAALPEPYTTIAVDLAGHGAAVRNAGPFTVTRFADDLCAVLTAERVKDVVLIGHSAGAAVCVQAAVIRPDLIRHVIALDGLVHQVYRRRGRLSSTALCAAVRLAYRRFTLSIVGDRPDPDLVERLLATPRRAAASCLYSVLRWDRDRTLGRISVPVSLIPASAHDELPLDPAVRERCEVRPTIEGDHFYLLHNPHATAYAIVSAIHDQGES